jgi:hypothetical protein
MTVRYDRGMERLVGDMVRDAITDCADLDEIDRLSSMEFTIAGRGVARCPGCGELLGYFPLGVVGGQRIATCPECWGYWRVILRRGQVIACHTMADMDETPRLVGDSSFRTGSE